MELLEDRLAPAGFGPEDGAYIVESWAGSYNDVKIQPTDQKIVAAGTVSGLSQDNRVAIARYDSLGNPDSSYGTGGLSTPPNPPGGQFAGGLVLQSDGKAVVSTTIAGNLGAGRFKTNGALDTTFSGDGWTSVNVNSDYFESATGIGLQSTGQIVVGGFSNALFAVMEREAILAGFKANGALNSGKGGFGDIVNNKAIGSTTNSFGGATASFQSILVQPDNRIVAVGALGTEDLFTLQVLVARYTANGALDTTFNGSGYTILTLPGISRTSVLFSNSGALQADGKIVVVSGALAVDGENDILVTRFNANGTLDTGFGGGAGYVRLDIDGAASPTSEYGKSVIIQPDGKIVAVGLVGGSVLVARLNTDGTLDSTFGAGGFKSATPASGLSFTPGGAALQSDGSIIVAGKGTDAGNVDHAFLMRFYGTASPLMAASTATRISTQSITLAQVQPLLTEALARWQSAGFDISSLTNIDVRIADLPGNTLGQAQGQTITLDSNAAGWGWFIDPTPRSDSEFTTPGNQGEQNRMDLLTALGHEIGHLLGHDHDEGGVMADTLASGVRRLPVAGTDWLAAVEAVFYESSSFKRRP